MATWDKVDRYFSGQGIVLLGQRDSAGNPTLLLPVGNVSDLKITNEVSVLEHKESKTGQRGTDKRITTETKVGLSMTMESFDSENLARASRGTHTALLAGTETDRPITFYANGVSPTPHIKTAFTNVKQAATVLVEYTNDVTPYDYLTNTEAGSIRWNDGTALAYSAAGKSITGVAVGADTVFTCVNTMVAGDRVFIYGLTGADAGQFNGSWHDVKAATGTNFTLELDTTGDTITAGSGKAVFNGMAMTTTYDYAAQNRVDALAAGSTELFMRFEGLNTAEENASVVIEVYKFSTDPLKELAMISDTIQQFVLEGSALADATKVTGSKYYRVIQQA